MVALLLEGAVIRVLRSLVDHGTRHAFARLTGEWPGDESPEPKETGTVSGKLSQLTPYLGGLLTHDDVHSQL